MNLKQLWCGLRTSHRYRRTGDLLRCQDCGYMPEANRPLSRPLCFFAWCSLIICILRAISPEMRTPIQVRWDSIPLALFFALALLNKDNMRWRP